MSQYFNKFPKIAYNNILLTDILSRISVMEGLKDNEDLYYYYDYQEGDTPEIIASKYYKNPELHWIVLLVNDIFDNKFDLPMEYETFNRYIEDKYYYIGKTSVKELRILNSGYGGGLVDGNYINVPLKIINSSSLSTIGSGITAKIVVYNGEIITATVESGGSLYDRNTLFTIEPQYLLSTEEESTVIISILSFMNGIEYASSTIDPEFGYQKIIRTSEIFPPAKLASIDIGDNSLVRPETYDFTRDKRIIAEQFYVLGKQSYYNLIVSPKGLWQASADYLVNDVIIHEIDGIESTYICNVSHTSDVDFGIDLIYGKWSLYDSTIISSIFYERTYSQIPQQTAVINSSNQTILYEIMRRYPLVTILDREIELNEEKRKIKLLKKEFVPIVSNQFNHLMGKINA